MSEIQRNAQTQQQIAVISPQFFYQERNAVGVAVINLSIPAPTESVLVKNTHLTQSLFIFLRSSASAWNTDSTTIAAGASLKFDGRISSFRLQGSGAGTTYEILATLE